jgi:hypothetical protein
VVEDGWRLWTRKFIYPSNLPHAKTQVRVGSYAQSKGSTLRKWSRVREQYQRDEPQIQSVVRAVGIGVGALSDMLSTCTVGAY